MDIDTLHKLKLGISLLTGRDYQETSKCAFQSCTDPGVTQYPIPLDVLVFWSQKRYHSTCIQLKAEACGEMNTKSELGRKEVPPGLQKC